MLHNAISTPLFKSTPWVILNQKDAKKPNWNIFKTIFMIFLCWRKYENPKITNP